MLYKDVGIVIKQIEYSDYDRILTILTQNHGKVIAIAKGARRLTSNKAASTDLFVKSKYSFAEGRSMDIVTETIVENVYENTKKDYDQISVLFYLSQVLDKLVVEGDVIQSGSIFQLFEGTLSLLCEISSNEKQGRIIVSAFELKLLKILGLLPNFYLCNSCGRELNKSVSFNFKPSIGGIICDACSNSSEGNLSVASIKSLRYLSESSLEKSLKFNCEETVLKSLTYVNKGMLAYFAELQIN